MVTKPNQEEGHKYVGDYHWVENCPKCSREFEIINSPPSSVEPESAA